MARDPVPDVLAAKHASEGDHQTGTVWQLEAVGAVAGAGGAPNAGKGDKGLGGLLFDDGDDASVASQCLPELFLAGIATVKLDKDTGSRKEIHVLSERLAPHDMYSWRADEQERRVEDALDAALEAALNSVERVVALLIRVFSIGEGDKGTSILHPLFGADNLEAIADALLRWQTGLNAVEDGSLFEPSQHVADVPKAKPDGKDGIKVEIPNLARNIVLGLCLCIFGYLCCLWRGE